MKREHTPGCYCCNAGPPGEVCPTACCDENENWPTFAPGASWQLRTRRINAECCCLTEVFDYIEGPVEECCLPAGTYEYILYGERNDYAFRKRAAHLNFLTQCAPPQCPTDCCHGTTPELVATWKDTHTHTFNYFFAARIWFDSLEIKYGKELIDCPGDAEPVCRYFIKYTIYGRCEAKVNTEEILHYKRELLYLHPCWTYAPDLPNSCTQFTSLSSCEFDETLVHRCIDPEQICSWPDDECCEQEDGCLQGVNTFCVERIKYFDEAPEGTIVFGEGDINTPPGGNPEEYCADPYCDTVCNNGYTTEVEIRSGTPLPPFWYTDPPTKISTDYTYLVEWDWCNAPGFFLHSTVAAPESCCPPVTALTTSCAPVACEDPNTTVTITCETFTDPRVNIVPEAPDVCRLKFYWVGPGAGADECGAFSGGPSTGAASIFCNAVVGDPPGASDDNAQTVQNCIGCGFDVNGPYSNCRWQGNCMRYIPPGEETCDPDCYASHICDGCLCSCVPLFLDYGFFSSNTANLTTSGSWMEQSCSYTGFNLTITVNT